MKVSTPDELSQAAQDCIKSMRRNTRHSWSTSDGSALRDELRMNGLIKQVEELGRMFSTPGGLWVISDKGWKWAELLRERETTDA
jgi:hypothetical protein